MRNRVDIRWKRCIISTGKYRRKNEKKKGFLPIWIDKKVIINLI